VKIILVSSILAFSPSLLFRCPESLTLATGRRWRLLAVFPSGVPQSHWPAISSHLPPPPKFKSHERGRAARVGRVASCRRGRNRRRGRRRSFMPVDFSFFHPTALRHLILRVGAQYRHRKAGVRGIIKTQDRAHQSRAMFDSLHYPYLASAGQPCPRPEIALRTDITEPRPWLSARNRGRIGRGWGWGWWGWGTRPRLSRHVLMLAEEGGL
jgi:hypothetical protein